MRQRKGPRYVGAAKAIALHAEANKSDPFAGARMSMTLRKGQDNSTKVAEAATRVITGRKSRIDNAFCTPDLWALRRSLAQQVRRSFTKKYMVAA